jgi:hypothetical protein
MASGQHNAAMIHLSGGRAALLDSCLAYPLNQSATARRTPVRNGFLCEHSVTLDADSFHNSKSTGSGFTHRIRLAG